MTPNFATTAILLLALLSSGCGDGRPKLTKVTGKVTLNGEPLADATIFAAPITDSKDRLQRPSSAVSDAQGNFTLGTYNKGDGLPLGKYRVGVLKRDVVGKAVPLELAEDINSSGVKFSWIVPEQLSNVETSGLEIEITSKGMVPPVIAIVREGAPKVTSPGQRPANDP